MSSPVRLLAHARSLWPRYTWLPAAPFVLWCSYCLMLGERRWELVVLMLGVPVLAYTNAKTKRLYGALMPFALVAIIYDAMRFIRTVGISAERVHVCDVRATEAMLFGRNSETVHDWVQPRATAGLDLLFAIPYGAYLLVPVAYTVFLYFRDYPGAQRVAWTFLVLNVVGFTVHHAFPTAPPWYFHAHGCNVDVATAGNAGPNLLRVDALTGVPFFTGLYGRSQDVFGAIPSLHVAYPLVLIMEGWNKHRALGRSLLIVFAIWMCCAAVYLDHHWVLDVVAGLALSVVVYLAVRAVQSWQRAHTAVNDPAAVTA